MAKAFLFGHWNQALIADFVQGLTLLWCYQKLDNNWSWGKNIIKKCRDSDQLPHRLSYGTTQICCCFSSCAFSFLFVYLLFISASPQFRHLPALRIQTHSDPPGAVAIVIKIISDNKNNSVAICFYKQISSWDTALSKHRQVRSYKYAQGNCRQRKTVIHRKYCCSEESQLWPLVPNYTWKQRLKAY